MRFLDRLRVAHNDPTRAEYRARQPAESSAGRAAPRDPKLPTRVASVSEGRSEAQPVGATRDGSPSRRAWLLFFLVALPVVALSLVSLGAVSTLDGAVCPRYDDWGKDLLRAAGVWFAAAILVAIVLRVARSRAAISLFWGIGVSVVPLLASVARAIDVELCFQ